MELIITRHGETEWNLEGRMQGFHDSPLSQLGLAQAKALAHRLARMQLGALYSSDTGRAMATARVVAAASSLAVTLDSRLREQNLGVFEGLRKEEIKESFPDAFAAYRRRDPDYQVPEGESRRQLYVRTVNCIEELAAKHIDQRVLVVAHIGNLNAIFRKWSGVPLDASRSFSVDNASLNVFRVVDRKYKLVTWGDVAHLRA